MSVTFAQMGFASAVTASSATPVTDGYVGELNGLPYHIHPTATPDAFTALEAAIAADEVTVNPYVAPTLTLAEAQAMQVATLQAAYQAAISQPVSFKNAAGVTATYAFGDTQTLAGSNAQQLLMEIIGAGAAAWTAGVWFDTTGKAQTMTFADLQGLAAAIEAMDTPDEQRLLSLVAQVQAATSIAAVQAITWS
jgi:hypothetical protein